MVAYILKQLDIAKPVKPFGIVDHDGVGWPVAEGEKTLEDATDRGDVCIDSRIVEQLTDLVLA